MIFTPVKPLSTGREQHKVIGEKILHGKLQWPVLVASGTAWRYTGNKKIALKRCHCEE